MGATGLLSALLWFGGAALLLASGTIPGGNAFFVVAGAFFVPLAIPASVLVGTALWRYAYSDANPELCGALFGGAASVVGLLAGAFGPATFLAASNVYRGDAAVPEAVASVAVLVPAGFVLSLATAGWLVVPLGIVGGWYHERAKRTSRG